MAQPTAPVERTNVIWEALAWPGYEHLSLEESAGGFTVDALIIAAIEDRPSRTWYRIELEQDWSVRRLSLAHATEFSGLDGRQLDLDNPAIELVRADDGAWSHNLGNQSIDLTGCTDIDIAVTPFTNTLPIRRFQLEEGEVEEIDVVYVAVPGLTLSPARQRYTRLDTSTYRFESLGSSFTADITVDEQGLVTDYPGFFRRVWPERDD